MGFDISKFEGAAKVFDEGIDVEIKHPVTGEPIGVTIRVASYQSERVKKVQRQLANTAMREQRRNAKKIMTVEEREQAANEMQAASVISWSGMEKDGKPLECTPANVKAVLSNPDLWFIGEQIDRAADDQSAFIRA